MERAAQREAEQPLWSNQLHINSPLSTDTLVTCTGSRGTDQAIHIYCFITWSMGMVSTTIAKDD
jgi:hypothetical protein